MRQLHKNLRQRSEKSLIFWICEEKIKIRKLYAKSKTFNSFFLEKKQQLISLILLRGKTQTHTQIRALACVMINFFGVEKIFPHKISRKKRQSVFFVFFFSCVCITSMGYAIRDNNTWLSLKRSVPYKKIRTANFVLSHLSIHLETVFGFLK
jgi:cytochrome c biogenesis protein ResB